MKSFQCYTCGGLFTSMWGNHCNGCREKRFQNKEVVEALKSINGKVAINLQEPCIPEDIDRLQNRLVELEKENTKLRLTINEMVAETTALYSKSVKQTAAAKLMLAAYDELKKASE